MIRLTIQYPSIKKPAWLAGLPALLLGAWVMAGLLAPETAHADLVPARIYPKFPPAADPLDSVIKALTDKFCPQFAHGVVMWQIPQYQKCVEYAKDIALLGTSEPAPPSTQAVRKPARGYAPMTAGVGIAAPTLRSSTPFLPFLGNRLVILSAVPNSDVETSVTALYSVGLRVQADCSLAEDLVLPGATTPATPNAMLIGTLPGAQDYLHQLAGLSTTPDVFAAGCNYPIQGQPSTGNFVLLGVTAGGAVIGATAPGSLYVSVADPTADTFRTTTLLSASTNPSLGGIAAGDLDGDGNVDLVASFATDPANQQFATVVFLGNGDGTFKAPVYYDVAGDIAIQDVNGDGKLDIVICGITPGITTLIGKGDGTFTPSALSATSITACGPAAGQIVPADFNGDGKMDLLVHNTVLIGHGDGTFVVGAAVSADSFLSEFGNTAVGDLNKDGHLDIVTSQGGFAAVFYGKGDGTFVAGPRYATLPDLQQVAIADIDGDGNPDIVLGASSGGTFTDGSYTIFPPAFQVLMGRGDGTFVDSLAYNYGQYGAGGGPRIATGDFNHDGKADALVAAASNVGGEPGTLYLLPGDGLGALGSAIASATAIAPSMLVSADMNADGKPDVVLAGSTLSGPQLAVLINQGNGSFAGERDYALPDTAVSLVTGDFNGDGRMDVAVGVAPGLGVSGPSGVYVLFGQANGSLGTPVKVDSSLNPTGLVAADINGDGRADLIVADQGLYAYAGSSDQVDGAVHVYLGNGNETFTAAASPTTTATNYGVAVLGDLNGDGKPDLILGGNVAGAQGSSEPSVYALLGNGDGTFQPAVATALPANYGIGSTSIAVADFNKDGHLDVAVGDATALTSVLLGNGDGTFTLTALALGQAPGALAAIDLNGDGFPELLVGTSPLYSSNGYLSVYLNENGWPAMNDTPAYSAGQVTFPTVYVGDTAYSDVVVTISGIASAPHGTTPQSSGVVYNPLTNQLTVPAVTLGAKTYYNVVATVGSLVSIGSVSDADSFGGGTLFIPTVQLLGGSTYQNVLITIGKLVGVGGGMPKAGSDQYNPVTRELLVPGVEYNGNVYTNVTVTVGSVISVGP